MLKQKGITEKMPTHRHTLRPLHHTMGQNHKDPIVHLLITKTTKYRVLNPQKTLQTELKTKKTIGECDVLFVSDSNGYDIDAKQLKPESRVHKDIRYTLETAKNVVPKVAKPHLVKDVVFQVGLNDVRNEDEKMPKPNPEEIKEIIEDKTLEMQKKYRSVFPNARQHIVAVPPMDTTHIQVNATLQMQIHWLELCQYKSIP